MSSVNLQAKESLLPGILFYSTRAQGTILTG